MYSAFNSERICPFRVKTAKIFNLSIFKNVAFME